MSTFYKVQIQEVQQETANAVSVLFAIPKNLQNEFHFTAGQYISIQKTINNQEIRRAYSICSSPNSGQVKVAIKAVENGVFSKYATSHLKAGDAIEITAPEGRFLLNPKPNKNYLAFAAGSGITPVVSMLKAVLETEPSATFTLIYGNKSVADTIFYNELIALEKKHQQFHLEFVFSKQPHESSKFGRIDSAITNFFIKNKYKETSFDSAFLCGPEEMINIISETLTKAAFTPENIFFELFTTSENKEAASTIKEGNSTITVVLDEEETTFIMAQTDTILAASLRHNLDAPYSCQGGVCSSCICKVTEGKAVMTKNSILTDSEIEDGLVLACQAHPTTETIKIDFDDV